MAAASSAPTETAPTAVSAPTYTVQRGSIENILALEGQVVATQQKDLVFTSGGLLQAIHVDAGSSIKKDQLLAELDPGDLTTQLQEAQDTYAKSKRALDLAAQGQGLAVRRAQIELDAAKAKLDRLQGPPSAVDVSRARATVAQAQAKLDKTRNDASETKNEAEQALKLAQRKLQDAQFAFAAAQQNEQRLNKKSSPEERAAVQAQLAQSLADMRSAEAEVASAQIKYDTAHGNEIALVNDAQASLELAQAELEAILNGPEPEELDEARRAVQTATLAIDEARLHASPDPETVQSVTDAEQKIATIRKQIDALRLYAPFSGRVVAVNAQQGQVMQPNQAFMTAIDDSIDPSVLQINTLSTSDPAAAALKVGNPVEIVFPSAGDKTIPGTIEQVLAGLPSGAASIAEPQAEAPAGPPSGDQRYIVRFGAEGLGIAAGDQARVTLVLAHRENVLWLPPEALRSEDQTYAMVQHGDKQERVAVQVGVRSADRVEILGGLSEGDLVVGQ
jgi:multidrug efflux pump subunit AcrA (membrane-fusion protein)